MAGKPAAGASPVTIGYWYALGAPGLIEQIEVDTAHFKGNYPDRCSVQATLAEGLDDVALSQQAGDWPELLSPAKLEMDRQHFFEGGSLNDIGAVNCLRLNIFPGWRGEPLSGIRQASALRCELFH